VKGFFYDWLGANEGLFQVLQAYHSEGVERLWGVLAYGYGWWMAPLVAAIISIHYLGTRHRASARQLNVMSQIMAILILSFAFVWCVVFTIQTLTFSTWARPWLLDGVVASHGPFIWQEGFPASAPAIAMMVGYLFWPYVQRRAKLALVVYVASGSVLTMLSGVSWPADVLYGLLTGFAGVWLARTYYRFAVRCVAS